MDLSQTKPFDHFPGPTPPLPPPSLPGAYGGPLGRGAGEVDTGPFTLGELEAALSATSNNKRGGPTGM
eukprot:13929437-Alexandrium_andersonii.AAC.1